MIHYIQSKENKWRIWITNNLNQNEFERFKDSKNNYPFIVPPTIEDRIDIYQNDNKGELYNLNFNNGCIIVIEKGIIKNIIYK